MFKYVSIQLTIYTQTFKDFIKHSKSNLYYIAKLFGETFKFEGKVLECK